MSALITLLTDFGPGSVYVGQMHAVLRRLAPASDVLDMAHDCPAGGIEAAAYILRRSYAGCPEGTVHVVVVDPGVGTARDIVAASARGHVFVGPDNGVFTDLVAGGEVRRVENRALMGETISSTFHGRDIMAPVAARLAQGTPLAQVGPLTEPLRIGDGPHFEHGRIAGRVLLEDRFGNLITNIPRRLVDLVGGGGRSVRVRVGAAFIDGLVETFGDVEPGRALAYIGSGEHLEIAVNGGRASDLLHWQVDMPVRVEPSG